MLRGALFRRAVRGADHGVCFMGSEILIPRPFTGAVSRGRLFMGSFMGSESLNAIKDSDPMKLQGL
jgi:hypothetical protein